MLLALPKYRIKLETFIFPIVGLAAFFVYIFAFNVDLQKIISEIQRIDLPLYLLAMVTSLLDTLFFSLAWYSLLRFLSVKVRFLKAFLFVWVGIFVDTIIPAESVSADIAKIYLVNREEAGSAGKATASLVAQRLVGMSLNTATLLAGIVLLWTQQLLSGMVLNLSLFLVALTSFSSVLILLLCSRERWTLLIVDKVIGFVGWLSRGHWKLDKMRQDVVGAMKAFHCAFREYAHAPKTLLITACFSILSWMSYLSVFYLTFQAIGYPQISWGTILVISAVFGMVKSIPLGIPFDVGLPEITITTLLILFGVPAETSATATILIRLLTLWLRFFIGVASQQWIGIKELTTSTSNKQR